MCVIARHREKMIEDERRQRKRERERRTRGKREHKPLSERDRDTKR